MLWTICVVLFILWLLGFLGGYTGGGLIHILLVKRYSIFRRWMTRISTTTMAM